MECGSWCGYYDSKRPMKLVRIAERGKGNPDMFELFQKLAIKREEERRNKIPRLSDCPICRKHALFYNQINDSFECLALECQHKIEAGTQEYKTMLLATVDQERASHTLWQRNYDFIFIFRL